MKAKEIMKQVKELNVVEFVKFKKEFYKFVEEIGAELSADDVKSTETKTVEVDKATKEPEAIQEPEATKKKKNTRKRNKDNYSKDNKRLNKKNEYKNFFKEVKKCGYEHDNEVASDNKILAIATKDTDRCVAAALVNHRGIATNVIYSPTYRYPMVFAKVSMDELENIKKEIMSKFSSSDDIKKIGRNKKWNGNENNFFYKEIEDGNFCYRMKDKEGNLIYGGYIIDENIAFYKMGDDISMIDVKYFFMPRWSTGETRDNYVELTDAINSLIDRAFNGGDDNTKNRRTKGEPVIEEPVDDNNKDLNVEDVQEEISAEVERQRRQQERMERRKARGRRERVETESKFSKPER